MLWICAGAQAATYSLPRTPWYTLHSEHFLVHYPEGLEAQAQRVLRLAEAVRQEIEGRLRWQPRERTAIVLTDRSDEANGMAMPLPRNRIVLHAARPDDVLGLETFADWMRLLVTHEYVHAVHLDKASDFPLDLRRLLGRQPLLFPNLYQPRWFIEGLATLHEGDGQDLPAGRLRSHYFRALMRMEAMGGIKSWRQVNQPVEVWPMGITPYLYGVEMLAYLRARLGEAPLLDLVERTSAQPIPYLFPLNFEPSFGWELPVLWRGFSEAVQARSAAETARVRRAGVRRGQAITRWGFFTGQPLHDARGLWLIRDDRISPKTLVRWENGRGTAVAWLFGMARLDHHPRAGLLVSQLAMRDSTLQHYELYRLEPGGALRRLTHGGRYRHATWSPDGTRIAAAREAGGRSALHLLDAEGRLLEVLWEGHETILAGLDWAPEGDHLVAALWRPDRRQWDLARFDLAERRWRLLTDDPAIQAHPRFAPDGALLYSADHDGIYDIWRIPPQGGVRERLTRVLGGAFQPSQGPDGRLYYAGLTERGQEVFLLRHPRPLERHPLPPPTPWQEPPPRPAATAEVPPRPYRPWPRVRPAYWLPLLDVTPERALVGAFLSGGDDLDWHRYALQGAYDLRQRVSEFQLEYRYDRWVTAAILRGGRGHLAYEDELGRLQRLRTQEGLSVALERPWLHFDRLFQLGLQAAATREFDVRRNGPEGEPPSHRLLLSGGLLWRTTQQYPLAIAPLYGHRLETVFDLSEETQGRGARLRVALRLASPPFAGRQALLFDTVVGRSFGAAPAFELGGTGPLSGADSGFSYDKRRYAFPGLAAARLQGDRLALFRLAWRFPIARVERGLMLPPVALRRLHGTLYGAQGRAWTPATPTEAHRAVGLELNLDLYLGYQIPLALRLGWARGQGRYAVSDWYVQWRLPLW